MMSATTAVELCRHVCHMLQRSVTLLDNAQMNTYKCSLVCSTTIAFIFDIVHNRVSDLEICGLHHDRT